jgi:hypothetical protein
MILKQAEQFAYRLAEEVPPADLYLHPNELAQYFNPANEIHQEKLDAIRQGGPGIHFPVQINTDGVHARIDDGHHRVTVAQQDGLNGVPVMVMPVDKYFFSGKKPGFAPPVGGGLKAYLGGH